jgi:hypothetical protein
MPAVFQVTGGREWDHRRSVLAGLSLETLSITVLLQRPGNHSVLFRLQGLDKLGQVCDPLLDFSRVALAHHPE